MQPSVYLIPGKVTADKVDAIAIQVKEKQCKKQDQAELLYMDLPPDFISGIWHSFNNSPIMMDNLHAVNLINEPNQ